LILDVLERTGGILWHTKSHFTKGIPETGPHKIVAFRNERFASRVDIAFIVSHDLRFGESGRPRLKEARLTGEIRRGFQQHSLGVERRKILEQFGSD
jgi:hypothetical protein